MRKVEAADGLPVVSGKELDAMGESLVIDAFRPAYKKHCFICRQSPVVKGVKDGRIVYNGSMCGPCTWGESAMLDPKEWNKS